MRLGCVASRAAFKENLTSVSPLEPLRLVRVLARTRVYERRNVEPCLLLHRRRGLLDRRLRCLLGLVVHSHQIVEHSVALLKLALLLGRGRSHLGVRRLNRVRRDRLVLRLLNGLWERVNRLGRGLLDDLRGGSRAAEHVQKVFNRLMLNGLGLYRLWLRDWLHVRRYLDLQCLWHLRHLWSVRQLRRRDGLNGRNAYGLRLLLLKRSRVGGGLLLASALNGRLVGPSRPLSLDVLGVDPLLTSVVVVLARFFHSGR